MKILYLAHRIPYPPNKGDKIRSYHQLRHLCARHDVWCACFVDRREDIQHVETLQQWCRKVHAVPLSRVGGILRAAGGMLRGGTATEAFYRSCDMERLLRRWSRDAEFDAALFFSSGVAQYHSTVTARRRVLDFCDWDSMKWACYARRASGLKARLLRAEADRLRRREREWVELFDASTVVTEAEKAAGPTDCQDRIHVVGNGIDAGPEPRVGADQAPPRVGFVGQMDYPPNVDAVCWFAEHVLPQIRRRVPNVEFEVVGRAPARRVKRLCNRPFIRVTGEVDDVRTYVEGFAVSVAPLRMAQGVQNKVLEAMAVARPVVATSTAASGIDATDGDHILVADHAGEIAGRVSELLQYPNRRKELGQAARCRVMQRYAWTPQINKLEAMLQETGASPDASRVPTTGRCRTRAAAGIA